MGEAIIKAAPDEDLYLIWSSIVDSPVWVGDHAGLHQHLWREYRRQHPDCTPSATSSPDARIARADATGTSMIDPPVYGWDHDALIVGEGSPRDGRWWELPRTNVAAYARALLADDEAAQHALLRPIEETSDDHT